MTVTIRPPVKWHGGKYYLAKRIVERFPPHHAYVEPYGDGAWRSTDRVPLGQGPSRVKKFVPTL